MIQLSLSSSIHRPAVTYLQDYIYNIYNILIYESCIYQAVYFISDHNTFWEWYSTWFYYKVRSADQILFHEILN
jgi:hypothetical protein